MSETAEGQLGHLLPELFDQYQSRPGGPSEELVDAISKVDPKVVANHLYHNLPTVETSVGAIKPVLESTPPTPEEEKYASRDFSRFVGYSDFGTEALRSGIFGLQGYLSLSRVLDGMPNHDTRKEWEGKVFLALKAVNNYIGLGNQNLSPAEYEERSYPKQFKILWDQTRYGRGNMGHLNVALQYLLMALEDHPKAQALENQITELVNKLEEVGVRQIRDANGKVVSDPLQQQPNETRDVWLQRLNGKVDQVSKIAIDALDLVAGEFPESENYPAATN